MGFEDHFLIEFFLNLFCLYLIFEDCFCFIQYTMTFIFLKKIFFEMIFLTCSALHNIFFLFYSINFMCVFIFIIFY